MRQSPSHLVCRCRPPTIQVAAVLDFRSKKSTIPNYTSRGEQRKLLALVLGLGFFLIMLNVVSNPDNWVWMWRMGQGGQAGQGAQGGGGPAQPGVAIDTRLPMEIPAGNEPNPIIHAPPAKAPPEEKPKFLPGIDFDLLAPVQDDKRLLSSENPGFYALLALLRDTDPKELAKYSRGVVPFIQLYQQPEVYRGEVVEVRGKVHRAIKTKPALNENGIKEHYQVWIEPDDRHDPVAVYCVELPPNFPDGDKLSERIELTGIFFKRWAYLWGNGELHSTPLMLAKSFKWLPKSQKAAEPEPNYVQITINVVGVLMVLLVLVIVLAKRGQKKENPYFKVASRNRGPIYESLKGLEVAPDVQEALRDIAGDASKSDKPPET